MQTLPAETISKKNYIKNRANLIAAIYNMMKKNYGTFTFIQRISANIYKNKRVEKHTETAQKEFLKLTET